MYALRHIINYAVGSRFKLLRWRAADVILLGTMVVSGLYVGFHDEAWQTEANNMLHPLAHAWTDHAWNDMADAATYSILLPQAYAQTPDPDAFVTTWNVTGTPVASTMNAAIVRFSIGVAPGGQVTIDWGNGDSPKTYNATGYATNAYLNKQPTMSKNATVVISGDLEHFYFHYTDPVTTNDSPQLLLSIDQWGDTEWSDMTEMFRGAVNMQYKATDTPDLSALPAVHSMFYNAKAFDGDLSNWDVSSMTSLGYMFNKAYAFNGDISGWNVSSVTDMTYMFSSASAFNGDISGWDVSSVKHMAQMFQQADAFNGDISGWNVSSVGSMYGMFIGATAFNSDISGWNVSSVSGEYDMFFMFRGATLFNQNLGPWFILLEDTSIGNNETLVTNISKRVGFETDIDNYTITGTDADNFVITGEQLFLNSTSDYYAKPLYDITITANTTEVRNLYLNVEPSLSTSIRVTSSPGTALTFSSATYSAETGILSITFSEPISTTPDLSKLHIRESGQSSGGITLTGATSQSVSVSTLTVTLSTSQKNAINGMSTPQLDIDAGAVSDISTNQITAAIDRPINSGVDNTPPRLASIERSNPAAATTDSQTLVYEVTFSEAVTGVDAADFELSPGSPGTDFRTYAYSSTPSLHVPYNVSKTDTITVPASATATSVSVSVDITHDYIGDLLVQLVAPDGTARTLHNRTGGSSDDIVKTYAPGFGSVSINGDWQLRIHDDYDGDEGTLNSWTLTLGHGANPITSVSGSGSQYHVTVASAQAGTYNLDVSQDNDIADAASNQLAGRTPTGADESYTVTAPVDDTVPVITLAGSPVVDVAVGAAYADAGATCLDDTDGDISSRVVVSNPVDTGAAQTYTVTYACMDNSNNSAVPVTRTVIVTDSAPTVASITRYDPAEQTTDSDTLQFNVTFSEAVTGVDAADFELSPGSPGTDFRTYAYSSTPSLHVPYNVSKTDTITVPASATATSVSVSVDITHDYIGDLLVQLVAPDGTARTLHNRTGGSSDDIVKTYAPGFGSVSINGDWQLRIHDDYDGDEGTLNSWTLTLGHGANPITSVSGSGSQYHVTVASAQAGTYNLDVSQDNDIADAASNQLAGRTPTGADESYTVTAPVDDTVPVITLAGSPVVDVAVGAAYADAGATCLDDTDGDISSRVVVSNPVDTGAAQTYTVTYACMDNSNNSAVPVTRTVIVTDSAPTVASITRYDPAEQTTDSDTLQFNVTFSEAVTGVDAADFELSPGSPGTDFRTYAYSSTPSLHVPYNVSKTDTITVPASATATSVSVSVDITHDYIGDLLVQLVAPDGTARTLHNRTGGSSDDIVKTYAPGFGSVSINGDWQLRIHDDYDGDEGTLNSWTLTLGHGANPITSVSGSGSQYHVTVASAQAGTYNLDVSQDNDIADAASNQLAGRTPTGADESYTVTAPVDDTVPVITLAGSPVVDVAVGAAYADAGATCLDDTDGDISSRVVVSNPVDTGAAQTYTVTYACMDNSNNSAVPVTRTVIVTDSAPTVASITRYDPAEQTTDSDTLQFNVTFSEAVTGVDAADFELSPGSPGTDFRTYAYSSTPSLHVPYNVSKTDTITVPASATATSVSVSVDITHDYIGDLLVQLVAPDGTARTLHNRTGGSSDDIVKTYAPGFGSVSINGDWQLRIHDDYDGDEGTLNSWTLTLGHGANPITSVSGSGSQYHVTVASAQAGTYNLDVSQDNDIADAASNQLAGRTPTGADESYTVTAPVDDTVPVITLAGSPVVDVAVGAAYADAGATCLDDTDGDISSRVVVSNPVDTGAAQTYTVTYACMDNSNNSAVPVTRTVIVTDSAPTVASITRYDPAEQTTDSDTLQFNVTFSEAVTGVDAADFELSPGSPGTDFRTYAYSSTPSLHVPYNVSKTDTITVPASATATSVSVSVDITHDYIGDLLVQLVAPDGTARTLHNRTGGSSDDIVKTYAPGFGSVSINGDWQLRIHDDYDGDEGTLNSWTLTLGHGANPITSVSGSGSQYHVTVASAQAGTYNLDVSQDNDIADAASNQLAGRTPTGADESYTVTAPVDDTVPVITLAGSPVVDVAVGAAYADAGATCLDDTDGDISSRVVVSNPVDTGAAQTYTVTYACMDNSNNSAVPVTRTVIVTDSAPTVASITRYDPAEQTTDSDTLQFNVTFSEAVTGVDAADFELSPGSPGTDFRTYAYSSTPSLHVPYNVSKTDTITVPASATATSVSVSVDITHDYIGDLLVQLVAPDGTARTLHNRTGGSSDDIVKTYAPGFGSVSINGDWQLRIHDDYDGDEGTLNSWTLTLGHGANPITSVSGSGSQYHVTVASAQAGTYNLDVSQDNDIADAASNQLAGRTPTGADESYTVTAPVDDTVPVITLAGSPVVDVAVGAAYADAGATCLDDTDGDISSRVVVSNPVDTGAAQTYTVTYACMDNSNNSAVPVTRTVIVTDSAPTVASITRYDPAEQTTDSDTLQFNVTFSEAVTGVDAADFELSPGSPGTDFRTYAYSSTPSLHVPYNVSKTDTITVPASATATSVSVSVDITHDYIGDLLVQLVAPDGTARTLHNRTGGSSDDIVKTYAPGFGSVSINGDWQLRIHDDYDGDEGTLNSWTLTLGHGANPITSVSGSGSQYHVTVASAQAGTYNLDVSQDNDIADAASNQLAGRTPTGADESYTVTAPVDDTVPVITLAGSPVVDVAVGAAYADAGATCLDDTDGDISSRVVVSNPVDTGAAQTYTVTYACMDNSNNSAVPVTRTVIVTDSAPTVASITRYDPAEQTTDSDTLQFNVTFSEAVTGVDAADFELSPGSPGTDFRTYAYSSTPSLHVPYNVSKTDTITVPASATATSVSVSVDITHDYIGDLLVQLVAPDGTARTLHNRTGGSSDDIVKTYAPGFGSVSINGDWQLRIHDDYDGDEGTLNSWTLTLGHGANPITSVSGSGSQYHVTVASAQAGTYNLDVSQDNDIADAASNQLAGRTPTGADESYTVTAPVDDTVPVITLAGSPVVDVAVGAAYADAGATCLDDTDGDISSRVVVSNPVDTGAAQTYTVTYACMDNSNNSAVPVTRTVIVTDSAPTVASITRYDPAEQTTDSDTLQFNVTFSEAVTGVDAADFELSPGSPGTDFRTYAYSSTPSLHVPYNVSKTDTITVPASATATSVSVSVDITHDYIGDLLVQLVAPDGTARTLHNRTGGSSDDIVKTYAPGFGSVSINGDWQLRIHDDYDGDEGTLNSWTLTLGHGANPITSVSGSGSQYHVTVASAQAGTYNLDVSQDNDIADAASNQLAGRTPTGADESYTVTAPVDDTVPVITLAGSPVVDVAVGAAYADAGATCLDDTDGDISSRVVVSNPVDTGAAQTYTVTYACMDNSNNSAVPVTRTVIVTDSAPTVASITRYDPAEQTTDSDTLQFNVTFSEAVTGVDAADFELSPGSPGTDFRTYAYSSTPSLHVPYNVSKTDTITVPASATATSVSVSVDITHDYIGDLLVQLVAPDGTARTLHNRTGGSSDDIVKTYAPGFGSVSINGDWQLRIHDDYDGDEGTLNSWTLTLGHGANPITSVSGSGSQYHVTVASAQAGTYNLDVSQDNDIADAASNQLAGRTPTGADESYTVTAPVDDTVPVITLAGSPVVDVAVGAAYADAGATCLDDTDGDISSRVVVSNPVDTGAAQTYTVTYACMDNSNNSAVPVTRTVIVTDSAPTVASITRYDPAEQTTDSDTLQFNVTFSEAVTGVDAADFELSPGSPGTDFRTYAYSSTPSLHVPYNVSKTDTITVPASATATSVSVSVDITHDYIGDLLVQLVAPDGTARTLHNRTGGSSDDIVKTYAPGFGSVSINGDWQLRIHDDYDGDEGTLNSWTLTLGHGANPITSVSGSGSQYHVTVASAQAGTYNLDVSQDNDIADAASNQLAGRTPTGADESYTVTA